MNLIRLALHEPNPDARKRLVRELRAAEHTLGLKLVIQRGRQKALMLDLDAMDAMRSRVSAGTEQRLSQVEALVAVLEGRVASLETRRGRGQRVEELESRIEALEGLVVP